MAQCLCQKRQTAYAPNLEDLKRVGADDKTDQADLEVYEQFVDLVIQGDPFYSADEESAYYRRVNNVWLSTCFNCESIAVWVHERLVHPGLKTGAVPNQDIPQEILKDIEEARGIVGQSARGAAALLRLAIQKLCAHLGESGKNIDQGIASLVQKGLNPQIQQALDVVRVVGNESVHPGTIDLRDDRETAARLFDLVNLIADQMLTYPRHIKEMYDQLASHRQAGGHC